MEITAGWRGQEIHVVGLGIDPESPALQQHLAHLLQLRRDRIVAIGERLRKAPRFADRDSTADVLRHGRRCPRACMWRGPWLPQAWSTRTQDAFDRYLGRGCVGHVPQQWPGVDLAIAAIRAAGGHAVLAHAHRYKLSAGALRNLCAEFAALGRQRAGSQPAGTVAR